MENINLAELVERVSAGDKKAFLKLCELKYSVAYYQAYAMLRNHHDAEDVTQNVMMAMYEKIGTLRSVYAFGSWFHSLINNQCVNFLRKKENRRDDVFYSEESDLRIEETKAWLPEDNMETAEFEEFLSDIIEKLPEKRKRAIVLYYFEDLSYKEIAEAMGISINTVASSIMRAKEFIKKQMKDIADFDVTFEEKEKENGKG